MCVNMYKINVLWTYLRMGARERWCYGPIGKVPRSEAVFSGGILPSAV